MVGKSGIRGKFARFGVLSMATALAATLPMAVEARDGAPVPVQLAQSEAPAQFNISAQPLSAALTAFGQQSGWQVSYPAGLADGLRSQAVTGSHRPAEALQLLLSGTGVGMRIVGERSAMLEKQTTGTLNVPAADVEAARFKDPGATEGTKSYAGSQATVGSKTPTTIREIPQSVSVVTRQRIEDRNFTTVDQAMRETTGMSVTPNDNNGHNLSSRGYQTQVQMDGLGVDQGTQHSNQFDLAIFDRLEILRGPSGLFSGGSTNPSGIVNFVHKRPTKDFSYGGAGTVGSWNLFRGEGDVSSSLFGSDRVRARLVAAGQDNDTFVDVTHNERTVGFGTVEFNLTEATTLRLGSGYQDQQAVHNGGLPTYTNGQFLDVDRSTFLGANWNRHQTTLFDNFADLEHRFDNGVTARVAARGLERKTDYKFAEPRGSVTRGVNTTTLDAYLGDFDQQDTSLDAYVSAPVQAFGQEHKLLVGADYSVMERTLRSGSAIGFTTMNIFAPNHAIAEPNTPFTNNSVAKNEQYGTYGQARIKPIDPLTLIVGARKLVGYQIHQPQQWRDNIELQHRARGHAVFWRDRRCDG